MLMLCLFLVKPNPRGKGYHMKNCLPADQCFNGSGTVYFGNTHVYENNQCCSTDLCNVNYSDGKYHLYHQHEGEYITVYVCLFPCFLNDIGNNLI